MCECMYVMVCLAVVCLCGNYLWWTIRYDWMVSLTALGLSKCLALRGVWIGQHLTSADYVTTLTLMAG